MTPMFAASTVLLTVASASNFNDLEDRNPYAKFAPGPWWNLTSDEFRDMVGKGKPDAPSENTLLRFVADPLVFINETIDWESAGAVTAVKDQHLGKGYGTCWSFATSGTMEGQELIASHRTPVDLSPQMLIDCCPQCHGHPDVSLDWLLQVGGQDTQDSYGPYQGKEGACKNQSAIVGQQVTAVRTIDEGEDQFMAMLQHGPMHVAIDCTSLHNYDSGILTDTTCTDPGNHDVLLVGAGETEDGIKYWRIKNSWGDWFGEGGFFRVQRGRGQLCLGKNNSWGSASTMVTGKPTSLPAMV